METEVLDQGASSWGRPIPEQSGEDLTSSSASLLPFFGRSSFRLTRVSFRETPAP